MTRWSVTFEADWGVRFSVVVAAMGPEQARQRAEAELATGRDWAHASWTWIATEALD